MEEEQWHSGGLLLRRFVFRKVEAIDWWWAMGRVQTAGDAPSCPMSPSRLPLRARERRLGTRQTQWWNWRSVPKVHHYPNHKKERLLVSRIDQATGHSRIYKYYTVSLCVSASQYDDVFQIKIWRWPYRRVMDGLTGLTLSCTWSSLVMEEGSLGRVVSEKAVTMTTLNLTSKY